ncbi:unnamed protein product [Schistosoma mattheei]|uniref:Uncharacterized protein n=1 Tax=Schistosoma mattheei TaxID=31246 RepID=A0A3P7YN80_9TREM|nr:unnamed protein product [Schistosoma mattheei]
MTVGTAVSAKYRGAFCEATVDHVDLKFRLRVQLKSNKVIQLHLFFHKYCLLSIHLSYKNSSITLNAMSYFRGLMYLWPLWLQLRKVIMQTRSCCSHLSIRSSITDYCQLAGCRLDQSMSRAGLCWSTVIGDFLANQS